MTIKPALLFLDTETTGNDVTADRLCQVCYKIGDELRTQNFKPPIPISVKAMSITHITNDMVAIEPPFVGSGMHTDLTERLQDAILVAHNARFDIAMLASEGLRVPRHICTLRLARYLDTDDEIPEYNLQYLRYHYGVNVAADPHSAEGDVIVLEAVFKHLYEAAKKLAPETSEEDIIERMVDISSKPSLFKRFGFGKHTGKSLEEVAQLDRSYLEWLLREKSKTPADEEDWIYTLQYYLRTQPALI